jgi:hypothetical protein
VKPSPISFTKITRGIPSSHGFSGRAVPVRSRQRAALAIRPGKIVGRSNAGGSLRLLSAHSILVPFAMRQNLALWSVSSHNLSRCKASEAVGRARSLPIRLGGHVDPWGLYAPRGSSMRCRWDRARTQFTPNRPTPMASVPHEHECNPICP